MAKDIPPLKKEISLESIEFTFGIGVKQAYAEALDVIEYQESKCFEHGVLIVDKDPQQYVGHFLAAANRGVPVFLGNPGWKEREWVQVSEMLTPEWVFGEVPYSLKGNRSVLGYSNLIMIPTGGTTGGVKFAMHSWANLVKSSLATQRFLGEAPINSYCVLPLFHISGLIQAVRSLVTEGLFQFGSLAPLIEKTFHNGVISLVPTQLQRILDSEESIAFLRSFMTIFVGGAAIDSGLLERSRDLGLRISMTYGMTETAAMVSALAPEAFLAGKSSAGKTLEHASVGVAEDRGIEIRSESLFYGYFPETPQKRETWRSEDEGWLDEVGNLNILGRSDRLINTGGEKVDPHEVEAAIKGTGLVGGVIVMGMKDSEWGEKVVAVCVKSGAEVSEASLNILLKETLVGYKVPKDYLFLDKLPVDEKGKVNRGKIEELLALKVGYCTL